MNLFDDQLADFREPHAPFTGRNSLTDHKKTKQEHKKFALSKISKKNQFPLLADYHMITNKLILCMICQFSFARSSLPDLPFLFCRRIIKHNIKLYLLTRHYHHCKFETIDFISLCFTELFYD